MSYTFECFVRHYPKYLYHRGARFIELSEDGCESERVLNTLLEPYRINFYEVVRGVYGPCLKENFWPWALLFFPEEYPLAGHVLSIRDDPLDLLFDYYSRDDSTFIRDGSMVPLLSYISVRSKHILEKAAQQLPLFDSSWQALKDRNEFRHWIHIADPPPKDWLAEAQAKDPALFARYADRLYQPPTFFFPEPNKEGVYRDWAKVIRTMDHITFDGE